MSLTEVVQERFGVMLFLDDLGSGESAACVRTDSDAAVLLNRNEALWRRRFSLAHELFHLVTWDAVMDSWPRGNRRTTWPDRVEKLANVFASALLLPGDDLRGEFQSRFEGREPSDPELVNMARAYGLSTSALLWRLGTLGLMEEEAVRARLGNGSFRSMDRASMPRRKPQPDLPDRFVRLVALAYRTGDISRSVAARYQETNPAELYYLDWDENDDWADNSGVEDGTIKEYEAEGEWNATG